MTPPASATAFTQLVADLLPAAADIDNSTWKVRKLPPPGPLSADSAWTLIRTDGPMVALTFREWPHGRRGKLTATLELPAALREFYGDDPALPRPEFRADASPQQVADKIAALLLPRWSAVHQVAQTRKAQADAYQRSCKAVSKALVAAVGDDLAVEQGWDYVSLAAGNGLVDGKMFIRSPRDVVIQLRTDDPAVAVAVARALGASLSTPDRATTI
ncbi:hypothetical protein [Nocardia sp. NRRL S-836]|uniref:hypothetical protein n=1 Tax=Nocardia sp. NRRL S-836 TaxID=1519492 RepID=UPI0006ADC84D|nr:hypothetical protein [Nocardia sp. NRRL S-836]KOV77450.1 hypothetical protein ADL03_41720 [Nocardia sp. NRRL S-836]